MVRRENHTTWEIEKRNRRVTVVSVLSHHHGDGNFMVIDFDYEGLSTVGEVQDSDVVKVTTSLNRAVLSAQEYVENEYL